MEAENKPVALDDSTIREQEFSRDQYLDLWKYFEGVGGANKDRMVSTVTWLLAFAVGILAYIGVEDIDLDKLCVTRPSEAVLFGCWVCFYAHSAVSWFSRLAPTPTFIGSGLINVEIESRIFPSCLPGNSLLKRGD